MFKIKKLIGLRLGSLKIVDLAGKLNERTKEE